METAGLLALAFLGLVWAGSGVALALHGHLPGPPVAAAGLTVAGAATLAAAVVDASGGADAARWLLVVAWALAFPLSVTAYPSLAWRHPVDLVALVTVLGAGGLAALQPYSDAVVQASGVVIACVLFMHTWWKLERGDAPARRALAWLAVTGSAAALVGLLLAFVAANDQGAAVAAVAFACVGPAMVVGAAVRPEVLDVRVVVVRVVVVAVALVCYIAVFVGVAALMEILLDRVPTTGELAVVGGLAALALPPLTRVLRGVVDDLLFGARSGPLEAATHVADHSAGDPVLALRAVREALGLPYAVLRVAGDVVATSGSATTRTHAVPLTLGGEPVGELEIGLREGEAALSRGDEHVIALVAPLLALTARSSALATQLQDSREQSVTAIAEERRRLRRDLHDGLGPRLSGIAFTADAAHNSVRTDPAAAEELLTALRAETTTAIEEIRGLVYAMRPPTLDELGLVQAVRQQALALRTPGGAPLHLELVAPADLPPVTAAVEVAAYRIVVESLTNAARHSGSDKVSVRLCGEGGALTIEVRDGGTSVGAPWRRGVGTSSMQERAQELGGTLVAGPTATGGVVRARLPLPS